MIKRDAVMFALYLVAIALGAQMMMNRDLWVATAGFLQVFLMAIFFAARLYICFRRSNRLR